MSGSNDWRADAVCAQIGPEAWFIAKGESARPAKKVCMSCPVRVQCLQFALEHHEHGIWGGTTENERRVMRADPARASSRPRRGVEVA